MNSLARTLVMTVILFYLSLVGIVCVLSNSNAKLEATKVANIAIILDLSNTNKAQLAIMRELRRELKKAYNKH